MAPTRAGRGMFKERGRNAPETCNNAHATGVKTTTARPLRGRDVRKTVKDRGHNPNNEKENGVEVGRNARTNGTLAAGLQRVGSPRRGGPPNSRRLTTRPTRPPRTPQGNVRSKRKNP